MKRQRMKNFSVRLTDEERMWLDKEAKAQMRSTGNLIGYIMSQYIENKNLEEKNNELINNTQL